MPEESSALTEIARHAIRNWGYPEHWISYAESDLTVSADYITSNEVYVVEENGKLLGFYALLINPSASKLDQMWVEPSHFGTGVGKELFLHAKEKAATLCSSHEVSTTSR